MATRKRKTRVRILRSPIEPGAMQVSAKTMFSLIPAAVLLVGLIGSWYVQRDHLQRVEHDADALKAQVNQIQLERAKEQDDHMLLLSIRDSIDRLKRKAGIE